ncbi:erythromycin esterase family protein [Streptomyces sp. NPDC096097]|uniref:erythromycin esterase family protein n=1 Tax=Streptomyces sp. NPDC096097 TaxID=3155546 RepID=UPI003334287D
MSDAADRWLAAHARTLDTLDPGAPYADLEPLRGVLRDVKIVGLGESTHGTREFFRLKHRVLEFLVRDMGCTVLAMEAGESAARAVDAYVCHGVGDPTRLIARLGFWTWRTEEMLDIVEWMRTHNLGVPADRRVRFVGIDPQLSADSVAALGSYLGQVAPERAADMAELEVLARARPGTGPDPEQRLLHRARSVAGFLDDNRAKFAELTSPQAAAEAVEHARILCRSADLVTRSLDPGSPQDNVFAVRDRYMAEAVARLTDDSGDSGDKGGSAGTAGTVALWAHNGHIAKGAYGNGVPALGSHLRARFGDGYYALGLLFGKGSFRARSANRTQGPGVRHRIGTSLRCVEGRLAAAVPGDYYVDLRAADPSSDGARWLREPSAQRSFGAAVPRLTYRFHLAPLTPAEDYDGLAFVSRSTCSRPLPDLDPEQP